MEEKQEKQDNYPYECFSLSLLQSCRISVHFPDNSVLVERISSMRRHIMMKQYSYHKCYLYTFQGSSPVRFFFAPLSNVTTIHLDDQQQKITNFCLVATPTGVCDNFDGVEDLIDRMSAVHTIHLFKTKRSSMLFSRNLRPNEYFMKSKTSLLTQKLLENIEIN